MDFILSKCVPSEDRLKCIVRVSHSTYKTPRGYSKRTDIRDLKVKSDLSMSDIFVDDSDLDAIENLYKVESGVYEIVPSSINYGTYKSPSSEVETWRLVKVVDND